MYLAHEVGAPGEARLAVLQWPGLCLAHRQKGLGHTVHELRRLPWQWLHCVAQLHDLQTPDGW